MTLYNEVERTKDFVIYILADLEELKLHFKKYNVSSLKWNMPHSVDTLEEAKEWLATVNSYDPISPETIYNSKIIEESTYLPDWLENKIGLSGYELESITKNEVVIKTHTSFCLDYKNSIKVYSVWFDATPTLIAIEGRSDKDGNDAEILITNKDSYRLMVSYLYQLKAEQVVAEEETTTNKNISSMWGYFTEDLLKEAK